MLYCDVVSSGPLSCFHFFHLCFSWKVCFFLFHFLSCSFIFFHFLSFSFMFFHFFFIFFHFSFIFYHFLSFSVIFFHFLSFSFVFVGCSKSDFFWASISSRFLLTVLLWKNQFLGPSRVVITLHWAPLFLFFLLFFPVFFLSFFLLLIFSFFVHSFFFDFLMFFISSFFLVFLSYIFHCWHQYQSLTVDVSSVVGAPWRCGVLMT